MLNIPSVSTENGKNNQGADDSLATDDNPCFINYG